MTSPPNIPKSRWDTHEDLMADADRRAQRDPLVAALATDLRAARHYGEQCRRLLNEPVEVTDEMADRIALYLWMKEFTYYQDSPSSVAAARRRWDNATDEVRQSWRNHGRAALTAAFTPEAPNA